MTSTVVVRRCEACRAELPSLGRSDRRYCDAACRVVAYRRRHAAPPPPAPDLDRLVAALDRPTAEIALVAGIAQAARQDWRAAAFILARRWPSRWAAAGVAADPDDLDDL